MTTINPGQRVLDRHAAADPSAKPLRISLCWNFTCRRLASESGPQSDPSDRPALHEDGVLILEIAAGGDGRAVLEARVERGSSLRVIHDSLPATFELARLEEWEQFTVRAAGRVCLIVLLRAGRPGWIRSSLPHSAGLPGGTYESPVMTLLRPADWIWSGESR